MTSPFLNEMPQELLDITDRTGLPGIGERDELPRAVFSTKPSGYREQFRRGKMVRHPQFGLGRIADVSDMGQHTRAVVEFTSRGGRR